MRRAATALFGVLLLVAPGFAAAEVLEIELALATPPYVGSLTSTDFDLGIPVSAVSRVALRLVGSYQDIMYVNTFDPFSFAYGPADLDAHIGDHVATSAFTTARHEFPSGGGDFDIELELLAGDPTDWPFLADGLGQVGLSFGPGMLYNDYGQIFSAAGGFGSVTAAYLLVTYDPALPSEGRSWGALKATFR